MPRTLRRFDPDELRARGVSPGWEQAEGSVLANARLGVYLVRVVTMEGDRPLHDFVMRVERGGGVFVPVDPAGRVGLMPVWRPQTRDVGAYRARFPDIDFDALGRVSYEVPRGFGELGEDGAKTAVREAEEEARGRVTAAGPLGPICDNTTFSPHLSEVVWGTVDAAGDPAADEGMLARLEFFTRGELARLARDGKLYDGFTLSALALLWIQHPHLFAEASR